MVVKNKDLETIAKGAGIVFIALIIGKFLAYLTKMFLARYLGPADYGLFALSLTIFMMFVTFSSLGINDGIVRFVAFYAARKDWKRVKGTIISSIKIVLPISIFASMLTFVFSGNIASFFNKPIGLFIKIFSLAIPFFVTGGIFGGVLQGLKRMKIFSFVNEIYKNIIILVGAIIGTVIFGIIGAVAGFVIGYVLSFLLNFLYSKDALKIPKYITITRELIKFSWPLTFVVIIWSIAGYLDTMMLGYFKPASDVGIYNISFITASLLMVIYGAFTSIYYPLGSGYFSKKRDLSELYKIVTKWMFIISLPAFLIMFVFSSTILRIFFGSQYISGFIPLSILSFAFLFSIVVGPAAETLNILGKTKLNLFNTSLIAIIDFILNLILIPLYGIVGCAIATAIAIITVNFLSLLEIWWFKRINPFSFDFIKSSLIGLVLIGIFYIIIKSISISGILLDIIKFIAFFVFVVLFFILCVKAKIITKNDLVILRIIERKIGIKIDWLKDIIRKLI